MSITSFTFTAFVLVVLIVYYFLPRRPQNIWLLIASYTFTFVASPQFALILLVVSLANFLLAQKVRADNKPQSIVLWAGIGLNLFALAFFKFSGFFVPAFSSLLERMGIHTAAGGLQILLPLGLSYYTLQAISYLLDVSRGQLQPSTNFVDFGLYMAYFPKLVAGPIERARAFLPKLAQNRIVDNDVLARSFTLILTGIFRKIVIADPLAALINNVAFYDPYQFSTGQLWSYLLAYAFSLYNDFAGYTSIVRGVSGLFGIELSPNFAIPYFSRTFNEFWNRWHISLSHWLRDYIYLPLSRTLLRRFPNRDHVLNIVLPPMITMAASGLWHASWDHKTILLWGLLHGVYQVGERLISLRWPSPPPDEMPRWQQELRAVIIFVLVLLAWVIFRDGSTVRSTLDVWRVLFWPHGTALPEWQILFLILLALLLDWVQFHARDEVVFTRWPLLARSALLAAAIVIIFLSSQSTIISPFVYQGF
jgi:alginate O-acetyltransferase complex protein AlgI